MSAPRLVFLVLPLFILGMASGAGEADARPPTLTKVKVEKTVTLPPGTLSNPSTQAVTVMCPDGAWLWDGTYIAHSELGKAVVGVHASVRGPDRYFIVLDSAGINSETVTVVAWCYTARGEVDGDKVALQKPVESKSTVNLGANAFGSAAVQCPKKTLPTFGGYTLPSGSDVNVVSSHPTGGVVAGWFFGFANNNATATHQVPVAAGCVPEELRFSTRRAARASRRSPRLNWRLVLRAATLPANSQTTVKAVCPKGYMAVSGGSGLADERPGITRLVTTIGGRSFSMTFQTSTYSSDAGVTAVCVRTKIA